MDGGERSITEETADVYQGATSFRLQASSDKVRIRKEFASPLDLTNKGLSIAFKYLDVSGTSDQTSVSVYLYDSTVISNPRRQYVTNVIPNADGWVRKDIPFYATAGGDADLSNIQMVRIETATRDTIDFLIDDLRVADKPNTGYVVVSADDNWQDDMEMAEIFGYYGIPISFLTNGYRVENLDY